MKFDLKLAAKRLLAGYADGTLSNYPTELEGASQFIEMYHFAFMDTLFKLGFTEVSDLERLLGTVIHIEHVGDVLDDRATTCMFGLVLLDRMAETGWGKNDFARCFYLHEQIFECLEQLIDSDKAKRKAREAAHVKHSGNRADKAKVFIWCDQNMKRFSSMDDAASDIAETFIPQKFRAVREWITEWKKLRSASTP